MPRKTSLVATDFSQALLCNRYHTCYIKRSMLILVFQKRSYLLVCGCPEVFPIFNAERLPNTQPLEEKWCTTWLSAPTEMVRHVFMTSSRLNWLPLCSKDLGAKREEQIWLLMISGEHVTCWNTSTIYLLGLEFLSVVNEGILPARGDLAWAGPTCKNQVVRM